MKRTGVSLIEMLVALSLAALLVTALSGVLKTLSRQAKSGQHASSAPSIQTLNRSLWNDLAQAQGVALDKGVLFLVKPHPNPTNAVGTLCVSYQIAAWRKDKFRLVRSVRNGTDLRARPILEQTMIWDINKANFWRVDDSGVDQPLPVRLGPTPGSFRYTLWIDDASKEQTHQITVR
jgi:prepilin-type N-terminal cleavage/methylation domain-containing protein